MICTQSEIDGQRLDFDMHTVLTFIFYNFDQQLQVL